MEEKIIEKKMRDITEITERICELKRESQRLQQIIKNTQKNETIYMEITLDQKRNQIAISLLTIIQNQNEIRTVSEITNLRTYFENHSNRMQQVLIFTSKHEPVYMKAFLEDLCDRASINELNWVLNS